MPISAFSLFLFLMLFVLLCISSYILPVNALCFAQRAVFGLPWGIWPYSAYPGEYGRAGVPPRCE